MKHHYRALIALPLCLLIATPAGAANATSKLDKKIAAQQARIQAVHAKLLQKRSQLHDAKIKVGSLQDQLNETNATITAVTARIGTLDAQMRSTSRKLAWNHTQLLAAQRTLARHNQALQRRLIDAYEHGDPGYVDVLFASRSFTDFVERWNDIRFVVKANEQTIRARRRDEAHVSGIERALESAQVQLTSEQSQAQQEHSALDALADERRNLVAVADAQRREVAQEVSELDEESAASEAALEELIRAKEREEEARRDAERRARLLAGESLPPVAGAPSALSWPASGPITSPFGMRTNPVTHAFILHGGIDIGVPTGTTVTAAAEGRVIIAAWDPGGCGNYIVVDHGGRLSTEYCHLSQFFVAVGQDVQRGQAIAASGATGNVTGPHLHFGVRIDGRPVDPMAYLH
jgi:murein DD-endopeptidase MepM/ murein hydrolase activator NlpD